MSLSVGDWYLESLEDTTLVDRLRWSTLGYHHDWDTKDSIVAIGSSVNCQWIGFNCWLSSIVDKLQMATTRSKVYREENRGKFPDELSELCECIASALGHTEFRAQAAIVNYYPPSSSLSGI